MAANSSSPPCMLSDTTVSAIRYLYIVTYTVLPPIYFVLGCALSLTAFLFFRRQLKKNGAYGYQLAGCCFKVFEICSLLASNRFGLYYAGFGPVGGWSAFRRSYGLMWYSCKIGNTVLGIAINQFIVFPSAIAVDRAFAMTMPYTHRNIDHKKHVLIASALTLFISTSIATDFPFDWDVVSTTEGDEYSLGYGAANAESWKKTMVNVRHGVRYTAFTVMVASTVVFLHKFRKRNKTKIGCSTQKQNASKYDEKILVVLSAVQCSIVCVYLAVSTLTITTRAYFPHFYVCQGPLVQYSFAFVTQISGVADYVILFMYNKKFREVITKKLECFKCKTAGNVMKNVR